MCKLFISCCYQTAYRGLGNSKLVCKDRLKTYLLRPDAKILDEIGEVKVHLFHAEVLVHGR